MSVDTNNNIGEYFTSHFSQALNDPYSIMQNATKHLSLINRMVDVFNSLREYNIKLHSNIWRSFKNKHDVKFNLCSLRSKIEKIDTFSEKITKSINDMNSGFYEFSITEKLDETKKNIEDLVKRINTTNKIISKLKIPVIDNVPNRAKVALGHVISKKDEYDDFVKRVNGCEGNVLSQPVLETFPLHYALPSDQISDMPTNPFTPETLSPHYAPDGVENFRFPHAPPAYEENGNGDQS